MLKKLYQEFRYIVNLVAEKWRLRARKDEVKASTQDVYVQYQGAPAWQKNLFFISLIILGITLAIVIYFEATNSPKFARLLFLPVPVEGYKVKVGEITQLVGASGIVGPHSEVTVTSRVNAATVQKVLVKIGDIVKSDTPLLEVDQSNYGPALAAAQEGITAAQLNSQKAEAILQATLEMKTKGLAEQGQVDAAQAALATAKQNEALAQSTLANAQQALAFTRLKSPLDSIVLTSLSEPGDVLLENAPVFTLGDIDMVYDIALVQEESLPYIARGQKAEVIFSSLPTQTFQGVVEKIDPAVNPTTRTFNAFIAIKNDNLILKPGVTGYARITITGTGLVIPESAVMNQYSEVANVFVVDADSHAVLTPVHLGLRGNHGYQVLSGLHEGDTVVSVGTQYLKENESVHVTFPPETH